VSGHVFVCQGYRFWYLILKLFRQFLLFILSLKVQVSMICNTLTFFLTCPFGQLTKSSCKSKSFGLVLYSPMKKTSGRGWGWPQASTLVAFHLSIPGRVILHPLPEVNFLMVEIPTPKPYIFMIRCTSRSTYLHVYLPSIDLW
jgi:hypothetical protein